MCLVFIPKEVLSLRLLLFRGLSTEDGFQGVWVITRIPRLGTYGHRRGREVLHLFELVPHTACEVGQLRHVALVATGMRGDEVRDELLVEVLLLVYAVEDAFELFEELERRFSHKHQHIVRRMLRGYLQTTAHVLCYQFASVLARSGIYLLVLALMEQQVVADTGTDEALLYLGQSIDSVVDVEQGGMVRIEVRTNLRVDARRTLALLARLQVVAVHAVHIGGRTA